MKSLESISSYRLPLEEALIPSDTIYSGVLSSTEQQITIPTNAEFVVFNSTGDFYANYDTTATVPSGNISEAGGELNPYIRYVGEVTTIHLIAPTSVKVTMAFYEK